MVRIETNKVNNEYIDFKRDEVVLLAVTSKVPKNIQEIIRNMHQKINVYEKEEDTGVHYFISIRKDSELGDYLLNASDIGIIHEEKEISYRKVVNAFNYAILEDNKIYEKIYPLFKDKITGIYEDLIEDYDEDVLTYILANGYFDIYNPERNTRVLSQVLSDTLVYEFNKEKNNIYALKSKR